jgi:hypothetical protein
MRLSSRKSGKRWLLVAVVAIAAAVLFLVSDLYPAAAFRSWWCSSGGQWQALRGEGVEVNPDSAWKVERAELVSACDNRPGLKMIYVTVLDVDGSSLSGVPVRFDTEPSVGIAYDHYNIRGVTNEHGYLEWDHLGKPTCYWMWVGDEIVPLVKGLCTNFGNEYCRPGTVSPWSPSGWVPINRNGIYSWRLEVQAK